MTYFVLLDPSKLFEAEKWIRRSKSNPILLGFGGGDGMLTVILKYFQSFRAVLFSAFTVMQACDIWWDQTGLISSTS